MRVSDLGPGVTVALPPGSAARSTIGEWRGRLMRVVTFALKHGKISQAEIIADPARLRGLDLAILNP